MKRFVLSFAAVMNLLLLDQVVKAVVLARMAVGDSVAVWPGFFNLTHVQNRGCAWGLLQGQVWPLAAFAAVALAVLLWRRRDVFPPGRLGAVAEVFLYAGILGNFVDRVWLGCVVDMFDFHWRAWHFPCFNVADSLITVSAFLLILRLTPRRK